MSHYLAVFRRRRWIILVPPVLAALVAVILAALQQPLYQATAKVLVNRSSVVSSVANVQDPSSIYANDPTRYLSTVASIARSPDLISQVIASAKVPGESVAKFLRQSKVSPESNADLLDVSVSDRNPDYAKRLADSYSTQFTLYKTQLDTSRINDALASLRLRLKTLAAHGATASAAYAASIQEEGQLETVGRLLANNTNVLQPAGPATKIRPRPKRDAMLGLFLGAVLGIGLAFVAEALDRKLWSEDEITAALNLPVLARVPQPDRTLRKANQLTMLADPTSIQAETYRKLRTSIDFANLERGARTIMVTSAIQQEGKSTTIANLAVALARAGRKVALVDLDLRRPYLNRFFRVSTSPGITDVAVGAVSLSDASRPIALTDSKPDSTNGRQGWNGKSEVNGVLEFLPSGTLPPAAGEFLEDDRIAAVLDELTDKFDLVLIDSPPMLAFSDAAALSARVDAFFVVVRLTMLRRPLLHELARQLQDARATALGVVLTNVEHGESYRYVYEAYGYDVRPATKNRPTTKGRSTDKGAKLRTP
jgi:succinoglycan biosynthesis transport protein ExoP